MKKEEFLKQENIPQFIKDLVANAPGNPDIHMATLKVDGSKEGGCSCNGCDRCKAVSDPDSIDLYSYLFDLDAVCSDLANLTDDYVCLKRDDAARVLAYASRISSVVAQLCIRLSDCVNEDKQ